MTRKFTYPNLNFKRLIELRFLVISLFSRSLDKYLIFLNIAYKLICQFFNELVQTQNDVQSRPYHSHSFYDICLRVMSCSMPHEFQRAKNKKYPHLC
jgi:hypothetical protein